MSTIAEAIRGGAARLEHAADNPRFEARLLLSHALGLTRNDLIRDPKRVIDTAHFDTLVKRRCSHEPLAHIVGRREFWSLDFQVSPATLIPRPDSETLIEAALAFFAGRKPPARIIDLGTGTGCLLLALLQAFPLAFGIGLDRQTAAVALAKSNAVQLGMADRSAFIAGDWTNAVNGQFDLVISNPPYIPAADINALMPEVAAYEPRSALDGGADGYDAYRAIVPAIRHLLTQDGVGILELGVGQAQHVSNLARGIGFDVSLRLDLGEIPRAISLMWPDD